MSRFTTLSLWMAGCLGCAPCMGVRADEPTAVDRFADNLGGATQGYELMEGALVLTLK